jgi:O-antigen ligase
MLKLIALVIYLPEELSFYIFQFRLTLIRLVLFLLTPVLLVRLGQSVASGKRHLIFSDILIVLTGSWMIISPAIVIDLGYSLHHSAPYALETCGSYLAGRILLSERGQALSFVNLWCHVIAIVAAFGGLDVLASRPVLHDFLRQLFGFAPLEIEFRLGIIRAVGPADHPILFGMVSAIGFLLAVTSPIRAKGLTIAACGLGVLLSMSSAPIQCAVLGLSLLAYDRTLVRVRSRWSLLIGFGALGIGVAYSLTNSPASFVLSHVLIDSASFWTRLYQWNTVGAIVLDSPWFGIGFELREVAQRMPFFVFSSVDSVWLNLALVYGIPGAILVGLSIVSAACYPSSGRGVNLTIEESKLATTLSILIAVIIVLGFTVDFWEASWITVGLVVGVRAHLADLGLQRSVSVAKTPPARARRQPSLSISVE